MTVTCPYCQYPNFNEATICRKCRKSLPSACANCGATRYEGAKFCAKCGSTFNDNPASEATADSNQDNPKRRALSKCPECLRSIDASANFCIFCGHVFEKAKQEKAELEISNEDELRIDSSSEISGLEAEAEALKDKNHEKQEVAESGPKSPSESRPMPPRPKTTGFRPISRPKSPLKKTPSPTDDKSDAQQPAKAEQPMAKLPPRPMQNNPVTSYRLLFEEEPGQGPKPASDRFRHQEKKEKISPRLPPRPKPSAGITPPPAPKVSTRHDTQPPISPSPPEEPSKTPRESVGLRDEELPKAPQEDVGLRDVGMMGTPAPNQGLEKQLEAIEQTPEIPGLVALPPKPMYKPLTEIGFRTGVPKGKIIEKMVPIDGGEFPYGAEGNITKIAPFYIDIHPVTNEQYRQFVETAGVEPPPDWMEGRYIHGTGNYPITMISFAEAEAYARWTGKRLPTDKEWERAARGTTAFAYPWGNDFDADKAHFNREYGCFKNVDSYPDGVSSEGCVDMMGNASEWVVSDHDPDTPVLRGGSYMEDPHLIKAFTRLFPENRARCAYVGFRCAATL